MKRWEYKLLDSREAGGSGWFGKSRESLEQYLNSLGAEDWELVNIDALELEGRRSFVGVAKREKKEVVASPNSGDVR